MSTITYNIKEDMNDNDKENNVQEKLNKIIIEYKNNEKIRMPSLSTIPKFYTSYVPFSDSQNKDKKCKSTNDNIKVDCICSTCKTETARRVMSSVHSAARRLKLEKKQLIPNPSLFSMLLQALQDEVSNDRMMDYSAFLSAKEKAPKEFTSRFNCRIFLCLKPNKKGQIDILTFYRYVLDQVFMNNLWVNLCYYSTDPLDGWLTYEDLRNWLTEVSSSIFGPVEPVTVFVETSLVRFTFFLDPLGRGKIKIKDLLCSSVYDEFKVQFSGEDDRDDHNRLDTSAALLDDSQLDPETSFTLPTTGSTNSNWFSVDHILGCVNQFQELDSNSDGYLCMDDLYDFRKYLTPSFVEALFQARPTVDGGMYYLEFLQLKMAMENMHTAAAVQYFFRILDRDCKGYLEPFDIHTFVKDHCDDEWDVRTSTFHLMGMILPKTPGRITWKDLLASSYPVTFISALIDTNQFDEWYNRDHLQGDFMNTVVM